MEVLYNFLYYRGLKKKGEKFLLWYDWEDDCNGIENCNYRY